MVVVFLVSRVMKVVKGNGSDSVRLLELGCYICLRFVFVVGGASVGYGAGGCGRAVAADAAAASCRFRSTA